MSVPKHLATELRTLAHWLRVDGTLPDSTLNAIHGQLSGVADYLDTAAPELETASDRAARPFVEEVRELATSIVEGRCARTLDGVAADLLRILPSPEPDGPSRATLARERIDARMEELEAARCVGTEYAVLARARIRLLLAEGRLPALSPAGAPEEAMAGGSRAPGLWWVKDMQGWDVVRVKPPVPGCWDTPTVWTTGRREQFIAPVSELDRKPFVVWGPFLGRAPGDPQAGQAMEVRLSHPVEQLQQLDDYLRRMDALEDPTQPVVEQMIELTEGLAGLVYATEEGRRAVDALPSKKPPE